MRERLIELIKESFDKPKYEFYTGGRNCAKGYVSAKTIADYLLANGVIVPPCKVGDTVWCVDEDYIHKGYIYAVAQNESTLWVSARYTSGLRYDHPSRDIGKDVFFTKEEAEAKLAELKGE